MRKLVFNSSKGTKMLFQGVGEWVAGEIKEVKDSDAEMLLKSFPCIKEVIEEKPQYPKKRKPIFTAKEDVVKDIVETKTDGEGVINDGNVI